MGVRAPATMTDVSGALMMGPFKWWELAWNDTGMIRSIDHVGIAVPDLDEAIAFYERVFGLSCTHVEVNEEQGVREAMLSAPEGAAMIQLLAPLRVDSPVGRFLERSGPGIQQMAYTVDDIRATAATMRSEGVRLLYDEPRTGTGGALINFVHPKDAGGVLVELVQPAPASH
jgi:methylmalonyl-CoA/ethylmalonyl-CoA epimerase